VLIPLSRDLPPAGGFEAVKYKRNLPLRGPGALAILGGVTAICTYGFYRIGLGNLERRYVVMRTAEMFGSAVAAVKRGPLLLRVDIRGPLDPADCRLLISPRSGPNMHPAADSRYRELNREKTWARIHLVPLLMAEGDRIDYEIMQRGAAMEARVMKDVKDWEVSSPCVHDVATDPASSIPG
jgi:hypothetical protein